MNASEAVQGGGKKNPTHCQPFSSNMETNAGEEKKKWARLVHLSDTRARVIIEQHLRVTFTQSTEYLTRTRGMP